MLPHEILDFMPSKIVSGQNSRSCQDDYWVGQAPPPKIIIIRGTGPPCSYSYVMEVSWGTLDLYTYVPFNNVCVKVCLSCSWHILCIYAYVHVCIYKYSTDYNAHVFHEFHTFHTSDKHGACLHRQTSLHAELHMFVSRAKHVHIKCTKSLYK